MTQSARISRRNFLNRASVMVAGSFVSASVSLGRTEPLAQATEPASDLLRRVVRSPDNTYFTYPHSNGFLSDGRCLLACPPTGNPSEGLELIAFDPATGSAERRVHVRGTRMYYSISRNNNVLISKKEGADVIDLKEKNPVTRRILAEQDWIVSADNDISPDGKFALLTRSHYSIPENYRTDVVEIASERVRTILAPGWPMDHAHFSPYDPSWISLAANRKQEMERLWVWNAEKAPLGRSLFRQIFPGGKKFVAGHERAMFHKLALLFVAYGQSTAGPRGLYEVTFEGLFRLVSESARDLHCNISRDGHWAVVSQQGTYSPEGARPTGDWLNTGLGYGFSDVIIVNMRSGVRQFLYRGTNATAGQPYEVHPAISPDGRWVLLKDAREKKVLFLEIKQSELRSFLST